VAPKKNHQSGKGGRGNEDKPSSNQTQKVVEKMTLSHPARGITEVIWSVAKIASEI